MRRPSLVLAAGLIASVVAVAPAAGTSAQTPKRGGTVVIAAAAHGACVPQSVRVLRVTHPVILVWSSPEPSTSPRKPRSGRTSSPLPMSC